MDEAFRLPGTRFRFGWDAILGLVPGIGDALTALFSLFILIHAFRIGVPAIVRTRMFMNIAIDLVVGSIPLFGDVFDFAWKSNTRNLDLLERHATGTASGTAADWLFVVAVVAAAVLLIAIPIALAVALLHALPPARRLF